MKNNINCFHIFSIMFIVAFFVFEFFALPPASFLRDIDRCVRHWSMEFSPESHEQSVRDAQEGESGYTTEDMEAIIKEAVRLRCSRIDIFFMIGLLALLVAFGKFSGTLDEQGAIAATGCAVARRAHPREGRLAAVGGRAGHWIQDRRGLARRRRGGDERRSVGEGRATLLAGHGEDAGDQDRA